MPSPRSPNAGEFAAWSLAWNVPGSLIGGVVVGWGLDALLGTRPIGMIVVGVVGLVWGLVRFMRGAGALNRRPTPPRVSGGGPSATRPRDGMAATTSRRTPPMGPGSERGSEPGSAPGSGREPGSGQA